MCRRFLEEMGKVEAAVLFTVMTAATEGLKTIPL
jgi:hypothetical protein